MKTFRMPSTDLVASKIALGGMRIAEKSDEELDLLVRTALDCGINFFDHADIYGGGECEKKFGGVLKRHPQWRKEMIIQTKCDIIPQRCYDTSREHILNQIRQSLENLQCGYIDILLIHRPDPLMDPAEVALIFRELKELGIVHYFGVSNHSVSRIRRLQKEMDFPLVVNQMQFSIVHSYMIDEMINVNMNSSCSLFHDDGILDYCLSHDMTLQAWCPLQASWEEGCFIDHPEYEKLNKELEKLAEKYDVTKAAIAIAWILRIPGAMMPVVGTTSLTHLKQAAAAADVELTRQEWYDLYLACSKPLP